MNKRQLKKLRQKDFIKTIQTVNSDDILIFYFDVKNCALDELELYANHLKQSINNQIIFISKDIGNIDAFEKVSAINQLENLLKQLKEI